MFIQYCEIECLSSQVFFLLCSSHRYNIQNIKFSLLIWRVIFAYLDSHEKVCSYISLFTYINTYIYIIILIFVEIAWINNNLIHLYYSIWITVFFAPWVNVTFEVHPVDYKLHFWNTTRCQCQFTSFLITCILHQVTGVIVAYDILN